MRSRTDGMWWGVTVEAPDPLALAHFYRELLGWAVVHQETGTVVLAPPQGAVYVRSACTSTRAEPAANPLAQLSTGGR